MSNSQNLEKAESILKSVEGQPLSVAERKAKAIELAALMLEEALRIQTTQEKVQQDQLARMMNDEKGKAFTTCMTDQCFRSDQSKRVGNQLVYLIGKMGVPGFLSTGRQWALKAFKILGNLLPGILVPITKNMVRNETASVILPGDPEELSAHMKKRREEGVRINLNHLGEAILGEQEAQNRLQIYLDDLAKPDVDYISVKISTICSQLNLLAWDDTLEVLAERLRKLYRAARGKFVNLDMEEYRDLWLTVDLFQKVLDEPEFKNYSAGIVLQAYLPDSFPIQKKLTEWAKARVENGGAPIKIRIVKGANLAMEQVEASLRVWPQAPYDKKSDVDANYKRMVVYGCQHAKYANLGIASHNLFDIAYALLLVHENRVEKDVCFEMLEGMADPMRRVVQTLSGDMLLYCPAATKEEFQNAVAYLVRRLDENTAPENFLRHAFGMSVGSKEWNNQAEMFSKACDAAETVSDQPRRTQNRMEVEEAPSPCSPFENEPDTDWSLPQNREWAHAILEKWKTKKLEDVYQKAPWREVDQALQTAHDAFKTWSLFSPYQRADLLGKIAHEMRLQRDDLIGAMVAETNKTIPEADVEISEAIDFAEYYRRNLLEITRFHDIQWQPKGVALITPPWNFPCSIPAGGILAALAGGNTVIFKPAPEAVYVGWVLAHIFWKAGVSKDVLQFLTCEDDPVGTQLIKDPRVSFIVLTGATSTAKLFLKLRPGLDLMAETGGKNAIIVTDLADRDLAVKDIVQSAFGHAGQKCSACSLAILEKEVYDNPHFLKHLKDAAESLYVDVAWNPKAKVNPLIRDPGEALKKGLTTLEPGEEWLLQPKQHPQHSHLWSPGIRLGVKEGSFAHQTEFFGPVLSVMRADNLQHAIRLANGTAYGLTSGIQSLDEREVNEWIDKIEAGNCYVNRGITGAIVQRQPFGGCKESSFGKGIKAGGPNYLTQMMRPVQVQLPVEAAEIPEKIRLLGKYIPEHTRALWETSIKNYVFYWKNYFSKDHDVSLLQGQDNILVYKPLKQMTLRVQKEDALVDILRIKAAAEICGTPLEASEESEEEFIHKLKQGHIKRVRLLQAPSTLLATALAETACNVILGPVLANGRLELLNYLHEVCYSIDYHRYGNLGLREGEKRKPLPSLEKDEGNCSSCACG